MASPEVAILQEEEHPKSKQGKLTDKERSEMLWLALEWAHCRLRHRRRGHKQVTVLIVVLRDGRGSLSLLAS